MYQHVSQYKKQEIQTASPGKLIVMLYDGAIRNLESAKTLFEEKDYEAGTEKRIKAQDIILELIGSLDFEKGGKIAKNLNILYSYILNRLRDVDFKNDASGFDESIKILSQLRDAWDKIVQEQTASKKHYARTG
jgi:flagellar protein FliS